MLSFTGRRNLFGNLTNTDDAATLTLADTLMNAGEKRILTSRAWPFLEKSDTVLTTAATQFKNIPQNVGKVQSVTVTVSTTIFTPKEAPSREFWDYLNLSTNVSSDFPEWYFIFNGQIGLYPTPASTGNTITINHRRIVKDLTIADFTTGTITSVANGGTAVVGSGMVWTPQMAGRFIRITDSNTSNTGDGFWYEISALPTTTTLTLLRPYAGLAIAAGAAAYIIGQMSLLPDGYHELPVYDAVKVYFGSIQPNPTQYKIYDTMYKEMMGQLIIDQSNKSSQQVVDWGDYAHERNPNLYIKL